MMIFAMPDDKFTAIIDATDQWTAVDSLLCGLVAAGLLAGDMLLRWEHGGQISTQDNFYRDLARITAASVTGMPEELLPADMRSGKESA